MSESDSILKLQDATTFLHELHEKTKEKSALNEKNRKKESNVERISNVINTKKRRSSLISSGLDIKNATEIDDGDNGKGLRACTLKLCEKLSKAKKINYNDLCDLIVEEIIAENPRSSTFTEEKFKSEDKNIKRRIYDARNILFALNIIKKDNKSLVWQGLDNISVGNEVILLNSYFNKARKDIMEKVITLEEACLRFVGWSFVSEVCDYKKKFEESILDSNSIVTHDQLLNRRISSLHPQRSFSGELDAQNDKHGTDFKSLKPDAISVPFILIETDALKSRLKLTDDFLEVDGEFRVCSHEVIVLNIGLSLYNHMKHGNIIFRIPEPIFEFLFAAEKAGITKIISGKILNEAPLPELSSSKSEQWPTEAGLQLLSQIAGAKNETADSAFRDIFGYHRNVSIPFMYPFPLNSEANSLNMFQSSVARLVPGVSYSLPNLLVSESVESFHSIKYPNMQPEKYIKKNS